MDSYKLCKRNSAFKGLNQTSNGAYIYSTIYLTILNYTTCFDPNGSSSGVFSYTSFTTDPLESKHLV
jgi:hypothetical protein